MFFSCAIAQTHERPGVGPRGQPTTSPLPELQELQPSAPTQILPPVPPPPPEEARQLPYLRVFVREIRVVGCTAFTAEEIATITTPYENRELTSDDLDELRFALTRLYIKEGYVTSGAIIPDQSVSEGVITLQIIEGQLFSIQLDGNEWFRSGYLSKRLALGAQPPVNINALQERLLLLQQDDRIERLNANLKPGVQIGESELHVKVTERLPFSVLLGANNFQSPTVGAERGFLTLAHQNLTGNGDILSLTGWYSEEQNLQYDASYSLPLTARDTTLSLRYSKNETSVIEEPFAPLDITTKTDTFGIILRHPFYRSLQKEFAVSLTAEREHSESFLLGEHFSFAAGSVDGETTVTPLRLTLEWIDRTQDQVVAARSRFTVGLDALGATIHDDSALPDGEFFAWLGQFQWAQRHEFLDLQTLFRLDAQLAEKSLLPLEQIAVGGRFSVRGYRENQLVRDNALIGSFAVRIPLVRQKSWADYLELVPFVDVGKGWNTDLPTPDLETISSVGVGLRWALTVHSKIPWRPQCEIYWGYPLEDIDTPGGDLQDYGIHFQFVIAAF